MGASVTTLSPNAGDLVWVDFGGARGTEQAGVRPAVVVSATTFNRVSRRSMVCPITSNVMPYPTKVVLPEGLPIRGAILTDQLRCADRATRGFRVVGRVPPDVLARVRSMIAEFIETDTL